MKTSLFGKFLKSGFVILFVFGGQSAWSQTTLSGNHVVAGNLNVGNAVTRGNLGVMGTTGDSAVTSLSVRGDGSVVFSGQMGVGRFPALSSTDNAFIWYPRKSALIVGGPGYEDDGSLVWFDNGYGSYSVSIGESAFAEGMESVAIGGRTYADHAVAIFGAAYGAYSFALGGAVTDNEGTFAVGMGTLVQGSYSVGLGYRNICYGYASATLGAELTSFYAYATVLGTANLTGSDEEEWINDSGGWNEEDPILIVGNGNPEVVGDRSDAFIIYKSGDVKIPKRQGDILMGEFGNPE